MTYCEYVASEGAKAVHVDYHDQDYGFPQRDERVLFERLILEINQAGLSWETILNRRVGMFEAYEGYDVDKVAAYGDQDIARLLGDPRIIRNKLKVNAAIENAKSVQWLRAEHGSFAAWLDAHHPLSKDEWVKVFRKTFRFVGGEIVNEFLMSLGYLPGAHDPTCPVYAKIEALNPPWLALRIP
jgi:DNA-3-methyladenine glycosylase I